MCVCAVLHACVCACVSHVRACVHACVCVCDSVGLIFYLHLAA